MEVNEFGNLTVVNLSQLSKAYSPRLVMDSVRNSVLMIGVPLKAYSPIVFKVEGNLILFNFTHPSNALELIDVTPSGIITDCKEIHL